MTNPTNTIIGSMAICIMIGYFTSQKYGNLELIMGISIVTGIVIGTIINFYLNRPKISKMRQNPNSYPQDKF